MTCNEVLYDAGAGLGLCGSMPAGTIGEIGLPGDGTPVISGFDPMPGSGIARLQHLEFDVLDDSEAFVAIFVHAVFPDGTVETVWDSDGFTPRYLAGSAVSIVDCGVHFVVRRAGGWYSTPVRLDIFAIDLDGNLTSSKTRF